MGEQEGSLAKPHDGQLRKGWETHARLFGLILHPSLLHCFLCLLQHLPLNRVFTFIISPIFTIISTFPIILFVSSIFFIITSIPISSPFSITSSLSIFSIFVYGCEGR